MRLKIRCDGKFEKFCKILWKLNKASKQSLRIPYPEGTGKEPNTHVPHVSGQCALFMWPPGHDGRSGVQT